VIKVRGFGLRHPYANSDHIGACRSNFRKFDRIIVQKQEAIEAKAKLPRKSLMFSDFGSS